MTIAVRMIGKREDAEEIVQDAFLRAYRSLGTFRGDARFGTWFYRILYNLCLTKITRKKDRPERPDDLAGEELSEVPSEGDVSVQDRMESDEMKEMVGEEIDSLPDKIKSVVVLFYLQDSSYEETATVLDIPIGTVKTYLHRGRNLLRARIVNRLKQQEKVV
jgi:RNA polymerase sigma-70 factor (ECF subfamily)